MNKVVKAGIGGLLCISPAVYAVERIGAFHSDIRIAATGELAVTETIEVQSAARDFAALLPLRSTHQLRQF